MPIIKLRMNSEGFVQVLKSSEVQADLSSRAARIQSAMPTDSNEEWETSSFTGRDRAQAIVRTGNTAARRTAAEHPSTVLGALAAGR